MTLPQFLQVILAAIFSVYPTPQPSRQQIVFENNTYAYATFTSNDLKLIKNWQNPRKFKDLVLENNCQFAVNGGFYDKQSKPIGLVVANKMTLNPGQKNYLFNGYLSDLGISYESPMMANWALQTGPMLWENNRPIKVNTTNDKSARRGAAIWSTDNKLHFVIFYNPQAETLGPYLNDLPELIMKLGQLEQLEIKSAINLDGGRASAFYDGQIFLDEIDPVGTVLCAK